MTLAQTINKLSQEHLDSGGLIVGQNLAENHNLAGTIPFSDNHPGICVLPTTETAGMGFSIGMALSGRPVIHIIRFASFLWYQSAPVWGLLSRAKEIWGYDIPLFIRVSSDDHISPVHSGMFHSMFLSMPGLKVVAPMTPKEYKQVWQEFQESKQPVLVSEHRASYGNSLELPDSANDPDPEITIIAIGAARMTAMDALPLLLAAGVKAEVRHIYQLKESPIWNVQRSVLIVGSEYENSGTLKNLAYWLYRNRSHTFKQPFHCRVLGMESRSPGVSRHQNGTPTAEAIVRYATRMLGK
jgi:pyruvate/2-oxoglutarate/acetoin dehydrogenase E1 component